MLTVNNLIGFGAGGADDAHLYWRIRLTAPNGSYIFTIADLEMRANVGGEDQCTGGTAFAIGSTAGYEAYKAFGGDPGQWSYSRAVIGDFLGYQFLAPVSVKQLSIRGLNGTYPIGSFVLEHSDLGVVYVPVAEWTNVASYWLDNNVNLFNV